MFGFKYTARHLKREAYALRKYLCGIQVNQAKDVSQHTNCVRILTSANQRLTNSKTVVMAATAGLVAGSHIFRGDESSLLYVIFTLE
jgi:hypothetical protein